MTQEVNRNAHIFTLFYACVCVCVCVFVMVRHVDKAWICSAEEFLELYGKVERWSKIICYKHVRNVCFLFSFIFIQPDWAKRTHDRVHLVINMHVSTIFSVINNYSGAQKALLEKGGTSYFNYVPWSPQQTIPDHRLYFSIQL